jgi:hypothetical protein
MTADDCVNGREVEVPTKPRTETTRAIDVMPYRYGIWCTVNGRAPFVNAVVRCSWSKDRKEICFVLDSMNFDRYAPDELIEVVPLDDYDKLSASMRTRIEREHDELRRGWIRESDFAGMMAL